MEEGGDGVNLIMKCSKFFKNFYSLYDEKHMHTYVGRLKCLVTDFNELREHKNAAAKNKKFT